MEHKKTKLNITLELPDEILELLKSSEEIINKENDDVKTFTNSILSLIKETLKIEIKENENTNNSN